MAVASSSSDQPSPEKAAEYKNAIEQHGDVDSMYKLASLLAFGSENIPSDPYRAVDLYRRAISEGRHLSSMLNLAVMLQNGYGDIAPNKESAAGLYELAIEDYDDAIALCKRALLTLGDTERTEEDEERALDYLQRSAEKGNAAALGELGLMHHVGWGSFSRDLGRAAAFFRKAIEVGRLTNSMYYLAWIVLDGYDDVPPNPNEAVRLLQQAIDEGNDTDAMVFLAKLLRDGQAGVPKDLDRSIELLERAVRAGHSSALYHLACLYMIPNTDENDARQDIPKAISLFEKAILENNDKHAMFKLAIILKDGYDNVPPDPVSAVKLLRSAADEGGQIHAILELSMLLRSGADGVEADEEGSHELLRKLDSRIHIGPRDIDVEAANLLIYAAERHDSYAEMLLGIHYKFGDEPFGLDKKKALGLLRRSANAGNPEAMFHLGMMLMDGIGSRGDDDDDDGNNKDNENGDVEDEEMVVEADMPQAMLLFRKAADEYDNLPAINVLASFLLEGYRNIKSNIPEAIRYLEKAINLGDTHSMNRLAMLHLEGQLLPGGKDVQKAVILFRKAVEKDDVNAAHNLAVLERDGRVSGHANISEASRLLQHAIERRRHFRSMVALADLLLFSSGGSESDREQAGRLLEEAVEMGDLDSGNLHTALRNGGYEDDNTFEDEMGDVDDDIDDDDLSIDYNGRAIMFKEAVLHGGRPVAFYALGCLVQESQADICADIRGAERWFQRAVDDGGDEGHNMSAIALANMLVQGEDDDLPMDMGRAKELLEDAAKKGSKEALTMLSALS